MRDQNQCCTQALKFARHLLYAGAIVEEVMREKGLSEADVRILLKE